MSEIIFGNKTKAVSPRKIPNKPDPKPRKKRSDAKHDIKFKLSLRDKKSLSLKALEHDMSVTAFASMIVQNDLLHDLEYEHFDYDNDGEFVHVELKKDFFEMVKTLKVEWNMPYRKIVHRIIKNYLWRSSGGIKIFSYNRSENK